MNFATNDLSAFYFDIRKDALYCDAPSSMRRKAALRTVSHIFDCLTAWLAPMLVFTAEESWLARQEQKGGDGKGGDEKGGGGKASFSSVHLRQFPEVPSSWRDDSLGEKWQKVRQVRKVVTGALEEARREIGLGSSLEAHPIVHVTDDSLAEALEGLDFAEICITSAIDVLQTAPPAQDGTFALPEVADVSVISRRAEGGKCARSWRISPEVGQDADYPDLCRRDADVMRELANGGSADGGSANDS